MKVEGTDLDKYLIILEDFFLILILDIMILEKKIFCTVEEIF